MSATSMRLADGQTAVQTNPTMLPQDIMLCDRFVCGTGDKHVQERVFAEKDLEFKCALDLALSSESALREQRGLKGARSSAEVTKASQPRKEGKASPQ